MLQWWKNRKYVKAKKAGHVDFVGDGRVIVTGKAYDNLSKTFVQPGQRVKKGAVLGKRK